jgi:two-component system, OmpR family, phosphate regulon sensor histidine kinase PhoR
VKVDFALDVRIVLTLLLLLVMGGAAWAWWRGGQPPRAAGKDALAAVFAHAPVAVLWLDGTGALRMANAHARVLTGIDTAAAILPAAEWQSRLLEDVQAVLESPADHERSRTMALPEQRTWHWWVTAWHGAGLVLIDDITSAQQAERATHLLLSDLAHELRTPLATLATHLEVLRLATVAPEIREQSVEFLRDETQRLVRLVNNTLELGRLQSSSGFELRPVHLFALVEAVVAQLHGEAQSRNVAVSVEAEANLPPVRGNADRLKQVLLNLLDNSLKYARAGDSVVVSLAYEAGGETGDNGGVACAVCDTGPGIAAEHLPFVTRRFYRAVPSGMPGSGLGLALAAEIVRQHSARLIVSSRDVATIEPGESTGTCVRFVLPLWRTGQTGLPEPRREGASV